MTHRHRRHGHRPPSIVFVSSCDACRHLIPGAEPFGDDQNMGITHRDCVGSLLAQGWIMTAGNEGIPDVACAHYHLARWEGGHVGCGCELDGMDGD